MKLRAFDPSWGLALGFLIVPLASTLNWLLLQVLFNGFYARLFPDFMQHWLAITLLSGPQGWMTTRLGQIWQKGSYSQARGLGFGCGLFAVAFWFWLARDPNNRWHAPDVGAVAIPFLWSIGFLVFPFFARVPKR
jgi:hypothetical protein